MGDKISQKPLGHAHVPSYDDERCSESLPSNVYELIKESFEDAERMTDECNATKSLGPIHILHQKLKHTHFIGTP